MFTVNEQRQKDGQIRNEAERPKDVTAQVAAKSRLDKPEDG